MKIVEILTLILISGLISFVVLGWFIKTKD